MKSNKTIRADEWILAIGILLFLTLIIFANIFRFNYAMNADIASEAVLAKLIWNEKEIVPRTWYSSTETRVIGTPNLAALFYGLTRNMTLSEGLACCVMTLMISASILFFGKKAGMKRTEIMLFIFLSLAVPVNMVILELLYLFACYYAIHVVILFFTLGVYVERIGSQKNNKIFTGLSIAAAFGLGIQGVRGILVLYGPLFGIEMVRTAYRIYCNKKSRKMDWLNSIWVCSLLAVSFIGTCVPFSTGQGFSRNIRKGLMKLFTVVFPNIKKAIGFEQVGIYGKLFLCVLFIITVYMVGSAVISLCKKKEIDAVIWAFLVIAASPAVTALMIAFTTVEDSERYYFLFVFAMALALVLMRRKMNHRWNLSGGVLAAAFVMINIYTVYRPIIFSQEPPAVAAYAVGEYLEKENCQIAYATFENANLITVLTNGRVQVAAVASVDQMDICKWLTCTDWYVPNVPFEGRTAYIITESEMETFCDFLDRHKEQINFVQKIGKYSIYIADYNFSTM